MKAKRSKMVSPPDRSMEARTVRVDGEQVMKKNYSITRLLKENWRQSAKLLALADELNLTGLFNIGDRFFASISITSSKSQVKRN